jgi:acyl-CoA thioester hydrolase
MLELDVTYRGTVYPWHCDHMGHMNVMWYVGKFDEATWQLFLSLGLSRSRLVQDGTGMVAVEQHIEYKRELRAGDLISIRSTVLEVREKTIRFAHEMRNDETGEVAATTAIVGVYFDTKARRARPLPADIHERAKLAMEGNSDKQEQQAKAVT